MDKAVANPPMKDRQNDDPTPIATPGGVASAVALSTALAACGDGGDGNTTVTKAVSNEDAARFLGQAAVAATDAEIARVRELGVAGWIDEQFSMPAGISRWDWLVARGFDQYVDPADPANDGVPRFQSALHGADQANWFKAIHEPDTLRQRVTLALSEIFVVSLKGLTGGGTFRGMGGAGYMDMLERHAFGNYRALLGDVTSSLAMGCYLSMRGNRKANGRGSEPDENYAREVLQLFSIGLYELDGSGNPVTDANGNPVETYDQTDIENLSRVFTGWDLDRTAYNKLHPDHWTRPMRFFPERHDTGEKSFLGTVIAAGTDGEVALQMAMDAIAAHPNVGQFIGKQLIQRLVTSNPSAAYVGRVAAAFNDDGYGVRGNLRAVVKAILVDTEARDIATMASQRDAGKLREPMLRFAQWARTFKVNDPSDEWKFRDMSAETRLGQSPLRSPSVFNFFRPGYSPASTELNDYGLVAPELQIASEATVAGYANFMQSVIKNGFAGIKPDYTDELALADDAAALIDRIQLLLTGSQLSPDSYFPIVRAVESMNVSGTGWRENRVYAAILLVMISPDYLVQK